MKETRSNLVPIILGILGLFVLTFAVTASALAADVVTLKFANYYQPQAPQSKLCEQFIKDLEAQTNGSVKVNYFSGGSLLNGPNMIKGVESGITDIGLSHIQYNPGRMAVTEACDLPNAFPSGWVSCHVVSDYYNQFKPKEWEAVKVLFLFTNNPSVLVCNKPIRTMEDLKGTIIRAPGPIGEVIKALGGTPAPIPIVETYDAISKNVVAGAFVSMETLKTFRFAEVAKYVTNAWHVGSTYTYYIAMNPRAYNKMNADQKAIFDKLVGEYQEKMALLWNDIDFGGEAFGKENGVEFIELSPEEFKNWGDAASVVVKDYIKRMKGKGFKEEEIKGWLDFIAERTEFWTAKQKELQIKSVTGPAELRP